MGMQEGGGRWEMVDGRDGDKTETGRKFQMVRQTSARAENRKLSGMGWEAEEPEIASWSTTFPSRLDVAPLPVEGTGTQGSPDFD